MYDIIILDLNMPITDGYEACKKINDLYDDHNLLQQEDENSTGGLIKDLKPLLFACSGDDVESPEIKLKLDAAGFDKALTNPLTTNYIKQTMIAMII